MRSIVILRILIAFLFLQLFMTTAVSAFSVTVSPSRVSPGDVFRLRVTGVRGARPVTVELSGRSLPVSSCGRGCLIAIGALDLGTEPGRYTLVVRQGASIRRKTVTVRPGKFPAIHLTLPEDKVSPGEEDMRRITKEAEMVKSLTDTVTDRLWEGRFTRPVGGVVSTAYGTKRILNEQHESIHRGVDLRGSEGEEIKVSNRGKVVLAQELFFGGNTVIVDHGQGIYTIYMHLSRFAVSAGEVVERGSVIGFVGATGRASGPHLHFGAKIGGVSANPISLTELKL